MKKHWSLISLACAIPVFLSLVSCEKGAEISVVHITFDDTPYTLGSGYDANDIDPEANGCLKSGDIRVQAVGTEVTTITSSSCDGPLILLSIEGSDTGTFSGEMSFYTGSDDYYADGSGTGESISFVITEFPDSVGGTIRGSFSGRTADRDGGISFSGTFAVERLADDSLTGPSLFS